MKTAIVTSKSSLNHNTGSGHPESISRVTSILEKLKKNKKLIWKNPTSFDKDIIKQQLKMLSLSQMKLLINKTNNIELLIKKNSQISNQIVNNFILERLEASNN